MRHLIQSNSNGNNQDLIINHASQLDWERLIEAIALGTQQSLALSTILQTTADAVQQLLQCDRVLLYQFDPAESDQNEFLNGFQEPANLVTPVFSASQYWGVLIAHNDNVRKWNAEEIHRLQQIAIHVGIAINQSYLREQLQSAKESISAQDGIYASELKSIDISDRKKVELENWETQNFLNSIIENIPNMLFVKDAKNLQFLRFNNAGEELLGYSRKSLIGKSDYDFFPPEEADFFIAKDREVLANSKVLDIPEEVIQTKNKGERILHTKKIPIFDDSGHPQYLLGISEDITERRQAELALQDSEYRFQKIALSSPAGIYVLVRCLDGSTYLEYASSAFEDICEVSVKQLLENFNNYRALIHPDDLGGYQQAVTHSIKNLSTFTHSWRIITPSQKLKWVQVNSRNECRDNGDIAWYGVMLDITDLKQTEIALEIAKEVAEAATKEKSQFLANMSHEIRTPMNGVLGMAELLANTSLTEDQQDIVKTIRDSGDALLVIINDILDFSKIDSGMFQLEEHPFVVKDLILSVCSLLNNQALAKDIVVQYAISSDIPANVIGDSIRLRQILLNLIGNAIKFTQNSGSINISVAKNRMEDNRQLELTFSIMDTGVGINCDRINQLFQPFTQADSSISRKYGGTGLGLAISKSLVRLMGGDIWVESLGNIGGNPPDGWTSEIDETQGSNFYFTINLKVVSETKTISPDTLSHPQLDVNTNQSQYQILLAEDNLVNQKVAAMMLKKLGYIADIANNGLEVLQMVKKRVYDLILMDMQMPEMDGITATKIIRQSDQPQPRIIAITANALDQDRQTCFDAGMNDFVTKPLLLQDLNRIISESSQTNSKNQ
jgi:PAS domain S-box-containing protein